MKDGGSIILSGSVASVKGTAASPGFKFVTTIQAAIVLLF